MNRQTTSQQGLFGWIWPIILAGAGILLLLHNYLLIEVDISLIWAGLLILIGLIILLNGDIVFSRAHQTFGITRGSVEAGTLRATSGELDIRLRALDVPGRLIAGVYTARSRPGLETDDNRAIISMDRGKTWLLSMADWEIELARDLPWKLQLSSFLGRIEADLRGLIAEQVSLATGLADLVVIAPVEPPEAPIVLQSTFGNIMLTVPDGVEAKIDLQASPVFGVHIQNAEKWHTGEGYMCTPGFDSATEPLLITVRGTFGDLFLT